MEHKKLSDALNEISDKHLNEAIQPKKQPKLYWLGAVAAVLAFIIFLHSGGFTPAVQAVGLLAAPEYPEMVPYPENAINSNFGQDDYERWQASIRQQYNQPEGYADGLEQFFASAIPEFLAEGDDNAVCSPLNIYMALAMLAETAGGESRGQILDLLNTGSMDALRAQAGHVWNAHYRADGSMSSLLANSLWLDEGYAYDTSTVDTLKNHYYASVYQGNLGSSEMNASLQAWLSQQTQGLLDQYIENIELSPETILTLASAVFFQAQWTQANRFRPQNNTEGTFHAPGEDMVCTFMNQTQTYGPYYYGEDYGAVFLDLDLSGGMWLILPDEGYQVQDILESGHALGMILGTEEQHSTSIKVHLSVPKFDISAEADLQSGLTALGLGALFSPDTADFSSILPSAEGVWLGSVTHAARVVIDEEGVTAAAYTMESQYGAALPPEEEVYFTLDRPFLFVITSNDGLPLFAGVVNDP